MRLLEQQVRRNFAAIELADLPKEERGMTEDLLRSLAEAKLDVRDYEFAETRAEQATLIAPAKKRIEAVRVAIIWLSSHGGIFGPADVAHLTASLDVVAEQLG